MTKDQLLEIAGELVALRFFMATALSTLPKDKHSAAAISKRMNRLAALEALLRQEAKTKEPK